MSPHTFGAEPIRFASGTARRPGGLPPVSSRRLPHIWDGGTFLLWVSIFRNAAPDLKTVVEAGKGRAVILTEQRNTYRYMYSTRMTMPFPASYDGLLGQAPFFVVVKNRESLPPGARTALPAILLCCALRPGSLVSSRYTRKN